MRKLKLIFAACALMMGAGQTWATVDWTDKTSVITNPSFETDAAVSNATGNALNSASVTGWTILPTTTVSNAQAAVVNSSSTLSVLSGSDGATTGSKYFYVRQNWNNTGNFGITQTIAAANVPEGYYLLTCKIKTTSSTPASSHWYLSIQEGDKAAVVNSNAGSASEWLNYGVMLYKESDATNLTISAYMVAGASGDNKHYAMLIDDVQLKYVSPSDYNGISSTNTLDMTGAIYNEGIYNATNTVLPRGWQEYGRSKGNDNRTEGTGDTQLEGWANETFSRDYYQTINNLPSGKYTMTAKCHDSKSSGAYAYIYSNSIRQQVTMTADYSNITTPELSVTNGTVNIGIKIESGGATWMTGDNFRMTFTNPQRLSETDITTFTNNSEMTADTWYKYTIPTDGDYTFSVTDGTILYSVEDLAVLPSTTLASTSDASSVAFAEGSTLYIRSTKDQTLEISRVTPVVENGTYYLYDATNKVFLSRGDSYGTRATVDKYGLPFIWSNYSKCISFLDWSDSYMFFDQNDHTNCWVYTDGAADKGDNRLFAFEETTGGYYLRDLDKAVYLKNDGSVITVPTTTAGDATVWVLKTKEEHDAIVTAYATDNKTNVITDASLTSETNAAGFETWLAANRAAKDKTSLVTMPKFTSDTDADAAAWPFTAVRIDGNINYGTDYAESFRKSGYFAQTVTGLSEGIYKVTVNAFERINGYAVCNTMGADGWEPVTAYLEANGQKTQLASWYSDKTDTNNPNNTSEAATAFNNDKYRVEVYAYVDDSGELEIKINKPSFAWDSWVLFNNVTLTYYDTSISDAERTDILDEATTAMGSPMKASLYQALATAKSNFEDENTVPNYNALRTAIDNTATSISSYANMYTNYLSPLNTYFATTNFVQSSAYDTYLSYKDAYDNYTDAETADVENATANGLSITSGGGTNYTSTYSLFMLPSWTIGGNAASTTGSGFYINTWSTESAGEGDAKDFANPFYEYWVSSGSLAATTLEGTITGLTANTAYDVTANVRVQGSSKVAGSITMEVEGGVPVDVTAGSQIGETTRYIESYTATGVTDGSGNLVLRFNVAANSNISWLAFRDVNYSVSETTASNNFTALNSAISNVESNLGFEDGEYAPYNNIDKVNALTTAKAFDQDRYYTPAAITAATTALTSVDWTEANDGEVNAIYDGDFDDAKDNVATNTLPKGWHGSDSHYSDGYWVRYMYSDGTSNTGLLHFSNSSAMMTKSTPRYGLDEGYTMPLKADTYYKLTFDFAGWGGGNSSLYTTIVVTDGDDNAVTVIPSRTETQNENGNSNSSAWKTYTGLFKTGSAGNYKLKFDKVEGDGSSYQITYGNIELKKAVAENITIAEDATSAPSVSYANVTLARAFNKGWNAVCLPFATAAFNDAEIAEFTGETGTENVTLNFTRVDAFEANKPYLVYFPAAVAANKVINGVLVNPATVNAEGTAFDFMGTYVVTDIEAGNWVISDGALKKASATISLKPTRTYFAPKAAGARIAGFTIDDDQTTGIAVIDRNGEMEIATDVYNLSGQKMNGQLKKGIYIVNGKKTVIK